MTSGLTLIVYPVRDVDRAKAVYSALLGVEPYVDTPYYIGYRAGEQEIGLDPNGHAQGQTGALAYRDVDDIAAASAALVAAGAEERSAPRDVGGGLLVATLADADGNVFGLRQAP